MLQDEELTSERRYLQLSEDRQSELIARHCLGIEERIRNAPSRDDAHGIATAACTAFEGECASGIIRDALARHIREKISQYWGRD